MRAGPLTGATAEVPEPRLPPGWRLVALDAVDSTSAEAAALADGGAPHGTVVWARRQRAGKGRRQRFWDSPPGNLYCSVLLRPGGDAAAGGRLTFVVALALADAIAVLHPGASIGLKWPNDVLLDGDKKTAGILLESGLDADNRLDWVVVGTGLNLVSHPTNAERPATNLRSALGAAVEPAAALEAYVAALDGWLRRLAQDGFAAVRSAWLSRAVGLGEPITVRLDTATMVGTFRDLDDDGALLLGLPDGGLRRITAGDVFIGGQHASGH